MEQIKIPFKSLARAIRIQNLLIIVFAQYFSALFLTGTENGYLEILKNQQLFFLSLSTVLVAAGGYIINDYYDIKIDFINRPDEVVIGRSITRRVALTIHVIFNFLGISIGILLSPLIGIIHLFSATLLWWYSNELKRHAVVGNIAISFLTGLSIYILTFIFPNAPLLIDYALFATSITLIREIIKDMEDVDGDKRYGLKTLPIIWGMRKTKRFIYVIIISFSVALLSVSYFHVPEYWVYIMIVFLTLMVGLSFQLYKADTKKKFGRISQYCKFIMLVGVLSMMLINEYL